MGRAEKSTGAPRHFVSFLRHHQQLTALSTVGKPAGPDEKKQDHARVAMFTATFFLPTGRCGTQWLSATLAREYGREIRVEHEPLQYEYEPRRMLAPGAIP